MRFSFVSAIAALVSFLTIAPQTTTAEPIRVRADLGQSVLPEGEDGRVFLRVSLEGEEEGSRAPANVIVVIDKSGSMKGDRIDQAREAALMAVERLGSDDVLGVIAYSDNATIVSRAGPLHNAAEVRERIRRLHAEGRTALYAGVAEAIRELKPFRDPNAVNRIILLSDGLANVGPSSSAELEGLGREAARDGITITTIGIGLGYNEDLMTRLALASDGNHAFVEHPHDLVRIFNEEFGDVLSAVGGEVDIEIECPEGFRPMRAVGRDAKIDGQNVSLKLGQVYRKQQKYVVIELAVDKAHARGTAAAANVKVNYHAMASKERRATEQKAEVRFSASREEATRSVNNEVVAAVTAQIATERNEKATALRDAGKTEEAKRVLKENAEYLDNQARALPAAAAAPLRDMSKKNVDDAENLDAGNWEKQRKVMRANQYRSKSQQSY
jgi:Ca-activated chloride channel homolog